MKKIAEKIVQALEIAINACMIALFHIKFFHEVAVFPGEDAITGEFVTHRVDYYYSILDNLGGTPFPYIPVSIGVILLSAFASVLAMICKSKKIKRAGHILFACSVIVFLFILWRASLVERAY